MAFFSISMTAERLREYFERDEVISVGVQVTSKVGGEWIVVFTRSVESSFPGAVVVGIVDENTGRELEHCTRVISDIEDDTDLALVIGAAIEAIMDDTKGEE